MTFLCATTEHLEHSGLIAARVTFIALVHKTLGFLTRNIVLELLQWKRLKRLWHCFVRSVLFKL